MPAELAACWHNLAGFIGTLDMALALRRIRKIPGSRALRDAIRGTGRYDTLMSPCLQMRIASLALEARIDVTIEPTEAGRRAPLDLRLSRGGTSCGAELMAVIRDAKTLDADRWLDTIDEELTRIGRLHGVDFSGRVEEPLDEPLTRKLLEELELRAASTAAGLVLGAVEIGALAPSRGPHREKAVD